MSGCHQGIGVTWASALVVACVLTGPHHLAADAGVKLDGYAEWWGDTQLIVESQRVRWDARTRVKLKKLKKVKDLARVRPAQKPPTGD